MCKSPLHSLLTALLEVEQHLPLADSHALVDTVLDRGHLVDGTLTGFGMVSSERDFPRLFADIYTRVAQTGTRLTAHAGDEAGPESIAASLAHLGVTRIDHGLAALALDRTLLAFCPWSDVALCNLPSLAVRVEDWAWIARGAVEGSWCGEERKRELAAEVDAVLGDFGHAQAAVA